MAIPKIPTIDSLHPYENQILITVGGYTDSVDFQFLQSRHRVKSEDSTGTWTEDGRLHLNDLEYYIDQCSQYFQVLITGLSPGLSSPLPEHPEPPPWGTEYEVQVRAISIDDTGSDETSDWSDVEVECTLRPPGTEKNRPGYTVADGVLPVGSKVGDLSTPSVYTQVAYGKTLRVPSIHGRPFYLTSVTVVNLDATGIITDGGYVITMSVPPGLKAVSATEQTADLTLTWNFMTDTIPTEMQAVDAPADPDSLYVYSFKSMEASSTVGEITFTFDFESQIETAESQIASPLPQILYIDKDNLFGFDGHALRITNPNELYITTLSDAGNTKAGGLWSDGTTMWVADWVDDKIYAYNLNASLVISLAEHSFGIRISKDFDTLNAAGNRNPVGIYSDGTTMWVSDNSDDKIYAYNLATKARDSSKDFDTLNAAGNNNPTGLYSDGTTMWVSDNDDQKIYAYNLATKARDSTKDFDTLIAAGNYPNGLYSDGTTMWVAD